VSPRELLAMKTIAIGSIFVLFAIVAGITATLPAAFAAEVDVPQGTSVPGCEDTNECWDPAEITIGVGETVTWTNSDSAAHTVTSGTAADGPDEIFDSSLFLAGTTFSVTLDEEGEYPYFCMVHPWMAGMITVGGAMDGGTMNGEELMVTITDSATDDGVQVDLEFNVIHVNYEITATQNSEIVLQETAHAHTDMMGSHMIPAAASDDNPVDIEIVSLGIGLPGEEADWSGPIDETIATTQVVPEFGTIAMMILGISIISIIAVTAKTRVIPKL